MLQNRVTPSGEIVATPERGRLMGDRGCLHDDSRRVIRNTQRSAWITCRLAWKGVRRTLMTPGMYTELFFLDEATALSAGHRPCGECRREDYARFRDALFAGNAGRMTAKSVGEMDRLLAEDRAATDGSKRTYESRVGDLPDGTMFILASSPTTPWLLWRGRMHRWAFGEYSENALILADETATVLTPRCTVGGLRAGYVPDVAL